MTTWHEDPMERERVAIAYLRRTLDREAAEAFEAHYVGCEECFQELRSAELLINALAEPTVNSRDLNGVVVLEFARAVELTAASPACSDLLSSIQNQNDSRVLIDLSRVSRIDSAGLGLLMRCFTHVVRADGAMKLLRPNDRVRTTLGVTHIDSVIEAYQNEAEALRSFGVTLG